MSGIMDMNGAGDGPPTRIGVFVGDLVTPLYCAYSILGALRHKEKTGEGQYLDASMIDTLATLMFMEPMEHILADGLPVRAGNDAFATMPLAFIDYWTATSSLRSAHRPDSTLFSAPLKRLTH